MTTRNPEDSVHDEQFDGKEKTSESAEENAEMVDAVGQPAAESVTAKGKIFQPMPYLIKRKMLPPMP